MGNARQKAPSESFDNQVEELAGVFGTTAAAISAALVAEASAQVASAGIHTLSRLDRLATDIAVALGSLLSVATHWTDTNVPAVYRRGVQDTLGALEGEPSNIDEVIGKPEHDAAIEAARNKIDADLHAAINGMGSDASRALGEIRARTVQQALAQDQAVSANLVDDFTAQMQRRGITFRDKAGREWQPEVYARMVLRTNVASTLNAGHLNAALDMGSRYVRVFDGGPGDVDEPCRIANGQTWHVLYAALHPLEHPNCRRSFAALDPSYDGPVDREAA
jgi:hypothetical protein